MLPAPHQIVADLDQTIRGQNITSRRSLVYHSWITLSSTLLGFAMGTAVGILLAVGIVHVPTLDRSLLPWIIASQTIPILAIAPMIIVVLGSIGLQGLLPKAIISMYLCFFPVTIGMVKGLRSPDPMQLDLMRTYSASKAQTLRLLRWPASLPFLFASLKVAIAISLVGAIVGELPTGATGGPRRTAPDRLVLRPDRPDLVGPGHGVVPGRHAGRPDRRDRAHGRPAQRAPAVIGDRLAWLAFACLAVGLLSPLGEAGWRAARQTSAPASSRSRPRSGAPCGGPQAWWPV